MSINKKGSQEVLNKTVLKRIKEDAAKMLASAEANMQVFDKMLKLLLEGERINIVAEIAMKTFKALCERGFDPEKAERLTPSIVAILINKLPTIFV